MRINERESAAELRNRKILFSVIKEFLSNRRPTGSKHLNSKYNLGVSPATIRNVLADYEKGEFLTHSFHCSGRIPTTKGLKFFIDSILCRSEIMDGGKIARFDEFTEEEPILKTASRALSLHSEWVGITASVGTGFEKYDFKLKYISGKKVLLYAISPNGKIREKLITLPVAISRKSFAFIRRFLLENKQTSAAGMKEKFRNIYEENLQNIRKLKEAAALLKEDKRVSLQTSFNPEIFKRQAGTLKKIFSVLEDSNTLIKKIMQNMPGEDFAVNFYLEKLPMGFDDLAIVASNFTLGSERFVCCVLGARFMNYMHILPLVKGVSVAAGKRLSEVI